MRMIIEGGRIVNEGACFEGVIVIDNDRITDILPGIRYPRGDYDRRVDATGCFVLPGVIDEHVHFREPGLTHKADIESESRAAAWGGVTTFFDMPNTVPQTTTVAALADKHAVAAQQSHVNYAFFLGATKDNEIEINRVDATRVPGIKLFMGVSTGNMLVEQREVLARIFRQCAERGLILMTHCEDTTIINANMQEAARLHGNDPAIEWHPHIRSEAACYTSSALAVELARHYGTRLHVAHLSTEKELSLFEPIVNGVLPQITAEAVIAHLWFSDHDYLTKGARIKCNPAIKQARDRDALRRALSTGYIAAIGTDHAPHTLQDKQGGCVGAASGMPMMQYSLVAMLTLIDEGVLAIERLVELMAHTPAKLFAVHARGFLRPGYKADIAIVERCAPWTVTDTTVQSKCGWTPLKGQVFRWRVRQTICNGHTVFDSGRLDENYRGEAVRFRQDDEKGGARP